MILIALYASLTKLNYQPLVSTVTCKWHYWE